MKTRYRRLLIGIVALTGIIAAAGAIAGAIENARALPPPTLAGKMSLEEALRLRRSVRQFADKPLTIEQIGQLCWAGQGITEPQRGLRTAPSAGALYPMELYVVTADGVEHYRPKEHALERHLAGDVRKAVHGNGANAQAPACFVIVAEMERCAKKYRDRAERYCLLEAGHIAQNILLEATALHLASVPVGGVDDDKAAAALKLPKGYRVLYAVPVGYPAAK